MPTKPGPFDLRRTGLILGPRGDATAKDISPTFYEELHRQFDGFAGHALVSEHSFDTPWSSWEMHPAGDEFVYLLDGDTDLVLWTAAGEQTVRVETPGSYVIVPRGTWHTARPRRRTRMLFVTPGEGTQNAERPPG